MKKTLCYEIVFRKYGRMKNNGFIIAEIEDNKIISLEGILTLDYLVARIDKNYIFLEYYVIDENFKKYIKDKVIQIRKEDIVLPLMLNIQADGEILEIRTSNRISDSDLVNRYQNDLKNLKSNVFETEQE